MSIYLGDIRVFNPLSIKVRDIEKENILIGKEFSIYENNQIETIRDNAFYSCSSLQSVNLPNVNYIGECAFSYCYSLQSANLLNVSYIGSYAFQDCSSLQSIDLPMVSYIGNYAFAYCRSLQVVNLSVANDIKSMAFRSCFHLLSLYLGSTSVCSLATSNAFSSTPIAGYTTSTGGVYGSIFVLASLYSDYITATNWAVFSSRFVSI